MEQATRENGGSFGSHVVEKPVRRTPNGSGLRAIFMPQGRRTPPPPGNRLSQNGAAHLQQRSERQRCVAGCLFGTERADDVIERGFIALHVGRLGTQSQNVNAVVGDQANSFDKCLGVDANTAQVTRAHPHNRG